MAKGFYLHYSGLWYIHQFRISYFVSANLKNVRAMKDINKPLLHPKFQTNWFETLEIKSVVYGLRSRIASKNPRPMSIIFSDYSNGNAYRWGAIMQGRIDKRDRMSNKLHEMTQPVILVSKKRLLSETFCMTTVI